MKKRLLLEIVCIFSIATILGLARIKAVNADSSLPDTPLTRMNLLPWPPRPDPITPDPPPAKLQPESLDCLNPVYTVHYGRYMRIVYMSYQDIKWEIYIRDGCQIPSINRLTNNSAFDGYPRLDNAMSRIVFVSDRDGQDEIYSMDIYGGHVQRLTSDAGVDTYPSWSPDGQQIVFVSDRSGNPDLYMMNGDGSNVQLLVHMDGMDVDPRWSPDGSQVAWAHWTSDTTGIIYTITVDGARTIVAMTENLYAPSHPSWTFDGKVLVFEADLDHDYWRDLAWITLSNQHLTWRPCSTVDYLEHCDFRLNGIWPEGNQALGMLITYVVNGSTLYIKSSLLTTLQLVEGGSGVSISTTSLEFYPDAVSLDSTPPTSRVLPLPQYSPAAGIVPTIKAIDTGIAGIYQVNVEYSTSDNPTWYPWLNTTIEGDPIEIVQAIPPSGMPALLPGTTLFLRSSAMDSASHLEAIHTTPDTSTRMYSWAATGKVTDQRDHPLNAAQVTVSPSPMNQPEVDSSGEVGIYMQSDGSVDATISSPGHASPPPQTFSSTFGHDLSFISVLPTGENILANSHFEDVVNPLNHWQFDGSIGVSVNAGHSGGQGVVIGQQCPGLVCFTPQESTQVLNMSASSMAISSDGVVHVIYRNVYDIYYIRRDLDGQWSNPLKILTGGSYYSFNLVVDSSGNLAFLYSSDSLGLQLAYKPKDQPWTFQSVPVGQSGLHVIRFDALGQIHILARGNLDHLYYMRRDVNGTWTHPVLIAESDASTSFDFQFAPDGTIHIVYITPTLYSFAYVRIRPNGELTVPEFVTPGISGNGSSPVPHLYLTPDGFLHLFINTSELFYMSHGPTGGWSGISTAADLGAPSPRYHFLSAITDDLGNLHVFVSLDNIEIYWLVKFAGQDQFISYDMKPDAGYRFSNLTISVSGKLHVLLTSETWPNPTYHKTLVVPGTPAYGKLSQTVTIPADMHRPTLSFLYRYEQFFPAGQTSLDVLVTPQDGDPVNLASFRSLGDWNHAWVDLTPWKLQTVTVSLQLSQAAGEAPASVSLDEVVLSAWTTFKIDTIEVHAPLPLLDWRSQPITVSLHGDNFSENARIWLGGLEIVPTWMDDTELSFVIPASLNPGSYAITVENDVDIQATALTRLQLGGAVFIPMVRR